MSKNTAEIDKELEAVLGSHRTRIQIIGTGGGGNNTVTRLLEVGIKGVEVLAVNTDAQDLLYAKADRKILIGKSITNGLGAGSDPAKGEDSARESLEELEEVLGDTDMVFITCGLGGGTGTGSAPIIAEVAQKSGALTIAVVTLPFSDEGIVRWENARNGLQELQKHVDTVIVVQNDRLLDLVPDMPLNAAFKVADEILVNAVKGITELVTEKGLVNLDFADVQAIMQNGGLAMIGLGESDGDSGSEEAAKKALQNPLLDVDVTGAKSALINITGGTEMSLKSAKTVMKCVAEKLDSSAKIIWGAKVNEDMNKTIRVMLIVTCLKSTKRSASEIEMALKKTAPKESAAMDLLHADRKDSNDEENEPAAEESSKSSEPPTKSGKAVFSDIFIEESEADISIMEGAIRRVALGNRSGNEKYFREIKNACTSLYNSAELFGYGDISELTEVVKKSMENAVEGKFDISESFLELIRKVPYALREMNAGDHEGHKLADEIKYRLNNIFELLNEPNGDDREINVKKDNGAGNEQSQEKAAAKERDQDSKNNKPNFSDIKEAVHYFDKLF